MDIQLLIVPYDSGNRGARMGAGPEKLLEVGLESALRESGHSVHTRTTRSGFLDGTTVAIITGRCWTQLAATIPGFTPILDDRVCLIGTRDLDSLEGVLLEESSVDVIEPKQLRSTLPRTLKSIREHVKTIYVHLDLDVLDSAVAPANSYALSGGLTLEDLDYALAQMPANSESLELRFPPTTRP
ncbi:MAG: arginase family protein [Gemmatimonadota bacterium]|nr:arginase family protein [Gemmatimonadota bacterium]